MQWYKWDNLWSRMKNNRRSMTEMLAQTYSSIT